MDKRDARRRVARQAAAVVRVFEPDSFPDVGNDADWRRVRDACDRLADELEARADGTPRTVADPIDPDQFTLDLL